MIKVAWLVRLAHVGDADEVRHAWDVDHANLLRSVPGIERASYNRALAVAEGPGAGVDAPAIDGLVCTWWTSEEVLRSGLRSPEWREVLDHARSLSDPGFDLATQGVHVEERVMRIGPGTPWSGADVPATLGKHVGVLFFRRDLSRSDASIHWTNVHGALALDIPEIRYYVQNHGSRPIALDGGDANGFAFDGFSEAWFTDRETFERSHESDAWQRLRADSPNVFEVAEIESGVNCIVDERVIKG